MKAEQPNSTIGYTCGSCWNSFEHFPGALMPCCPRCGNDRYVSVSRAEFKKVMRGESTVEGVPEPMQPPLL